MTSWEIYSQQSIGVREVSTHRHSAALAPTTHTHFPCENCAAQARAREHTTLLFGCALKNLHCFDQV